jgi:hypothetical protein
MMALVVGAVVFAAKPALEGRAAPRLRAAS